MDQATKLVIDTDQRKHAIVKVHTNPLTTIAEGLLLH